MLKEVNPEYSLEGLRLKLKLPNFGHLMRRAVSLNKTLGKMLGKTESRRGQQRMRAESHNYFCGEREEEESFKTQAERSMREQGKHEGVMRSDLRGFPQKQCYF